MKTYFIQDPRGRIKIGIAENPRQRLRQLQTGNPEKLVLLGCIEDDHEKDLHHKFRKYRVGGEWFTAEKELVEYVEQILSDKSLLPTSSQLRLTLTKQLSQEQQCKKLKLSLEYLAKKITAIVEFIKGLEDEEFDDWQIFYALREKHINAIRPRTDS